MSKTAPTRWRQIAAGLAVAGLVVAMTWLSFARTGVELNFVSLWEYRQRLWNGFVMTVIIAVGALALSLVLGLLTVMARRCGVLFFDYAARTYVQIIRGTPLLVQIYFFYYIIGTAWGLDNRYLVGTMILAIFEGAYVSEIIRGGWQSIGAQTYEIASVIGLTKRQTFRLVTLPLVAARTVPALAGQMASIIKDSSLLSVIAVIELTQTVQEISAENFQMFSNYFTLGVLYFALTAVVSGFSSWLEGRLSRALEA